MEGAGRGCEWLIGREGGYVAPCEVRGLGSGSESSREFGAKDKEAGDMKSEFSLVRDTRMRSGARIVVRLLT